MSENFETYYVPEQSKLPILASFGLFLTVFGLATWLNQIKQASGVGAQWLFIAGFVLLAMVIWKWFDGVIRENRQGLTSEQLKRSYVWAMGWFIFSEVMFFAAFFGALFYIRQISLPLLSEGETSELLWNNFKAQWPLMITPDMALNADSAKIIGPQDNMANPGFSAWFRWLPFLNTVILLTSSVTVHVAHSALKHDNKKIFNIMLALTVIFGIAFVSLQIEEYLDAYLNMGLTLSSGGYGSTFFMLTGFHGLHVTIGTFILAIQLYRSVAKNHFSHSDCFGFQAASWYWHFVDIVWVGLFLFVYIL